MLFCGYVMSRFEHWLKGMEQIHEHKWRCRKFQIDLGISLLNKGISMDWVGEKMPEYVQVTEFIPCDCKKCYFYLHGYTSGIAHADKKRAAPTVVQYKCGTTLKTKKCSTERVNLEKGSCYCRMCYMKQDKTLTYATKRKKCNTSRMGCEIFWELVCK